MESAANGHHHLQDQLLGSSSPSCYGIGTTSHAWSTTSHPILNNNGFHCYPIETIMNSREEHSSSYMAPSPSPSPDMSFHWANNTIPSTNSPQDLHLSTRIKDELSHNYYPKYTEMLSSTHQPEFSGRNERRSHNILQQNELGTKLLLMPYSSDHHTSKIDVSAADHCANNGRGYDQIFPAFHVPSLNQMGMADPCSLDMNLESLDLLASSRFSNNFGHNSLQNHGIFRDGFPYGFDHIQPSHQLLIPSPNKVSSTNNGVAAEAKRKMEMKSSLENASKKSRLEARSSCPPLKVRKEKLGDRIAALQQLVAPFGKTDTASVLMEAIGYIKFLQNQVETLSVPYMKASRNKSNRAIKAVQAEDENEEVKRDLKSRGLCLVPLSCLSYIADGGGATVWAPPHFGGAA